ncbi:MAG: IS110 family transposase [Solirubrobacterales bacterium]|uniref:IS110 family transposase n=1 Tax=Bradyrhizobium sp. TaxID=376 RepID=UPI0025C5A6D9|nr:IS110 family transposase [Bradyrhizobium sp.]MBV8919209.1 IS110 family transposase [Bradyrhizobium sp.]MBV9915193.1 IS110 family transposase [Solirubrobacterales bacterium]
MQATMTCVGLDVHARSTHAAAIDVVTGELRRVRFGEGTEEVVSWLADLNAPVRAVYEAGPTGFGLARQATKAGVHVVVAAPSKTPRAKGDRVKTDRKDAELLARLLLAGQLKPVVVPPDWLEAIRHLARTREQVRRDLARARHRVSKLLLVEGRVYPGATTWNWAHHNWLASQQFDFEATQLAFVDRLAAVDGLLARRRSLDERLSRIATDERLWPTISRLRCFRGVDTLTALMLHLELGGDWGRFSSPRQLSSWLGLTPSLDQSGESKTHGSITKTGSSIARRLLVESAWQYSRRPRIGQTLLSRQDGQPDHILQIAWKAQHRLHRVHKRFNARGKPANVATVAIARELAGFLWAAATAP